MIVMVGSVVEEEEAAEAEDDVAEEEEAALAEGGKVTKITVARLTAAKHHNINKENMLGHLTVLRPRTARQSKVDKIVQETKCLPSIRIFHRNTMEGNLALMTFMSGVVCGRSVGMRLDFLKMLR